MYIRKGAHAPLSFVLHFPKPKFFNKKKGKMNEAECNSYIERNAIALNFEFFSKILTSQQVTYIITHLNFTQNIKF
jgi:hypothetical protein